MKRWKKKNLEIPQQTHPANGANNHPHEKHQLERRQEEEEKQCIILKCALGNQMLVFSLTSIMIETPDLQRTLQYHHFFVKWLNSFKSAQHHTTS